MLHLDRNGYYGGECASLNLTNLFKKFNGGAEPPKAFFDALGSNRDYNVDLIPKFIMANGNLVKILVHTDVTRYLDFKLIDGSYVYKAGSGVFKVPADGAEALKTSLVGMFQKVKLKFFLEYVAQYEAANPATHKGYDLSKLTMQQLVSDKYGLDKDTIEFVGCVRCGPCGGARSRPRRAALPRVRSLEHAARSAPTPSPPRPSPAPASAATRWRCSRTTATSPGPPSTPSRPSACTPSP